MATLDCHATSSDGVTLVELVVTSDVRERVRVENCLDGPVWPPRRQGVPAEGWTEEGYEGEVGPADRLVAGYATPADPCEPPARLVRVEGADNDTETTPASLVRTLGDPRPPREGVGLPDSEGGYPLDEEPAADDGTDSTDGDTVGAAPAEAERDWADSATTEPDERTNDGADSEAAGNESAPEEAALPDESHPERTQSTPPTLDGEGLPPGFDAYLARVRERLDEAEGLAGPSTAGEASEALAAVGGPEQAAAMQEQLAADRERLARLGTECQRLAARIDAVDVPVETLARLT